MQYKTMVLEILHQRLELYEEVRSNRMLLPALESYALELKSLHEDWKEILRLKMPDSDPAQVSSEALELAVQAFQDFLPPASPPEDSETLSLDAAMAFITRHTPPV
ncbi:MAG TPA: hypothetical protein VK395_26860 [Gemmataceae bacterium]|nr:hypothetical protein [Gemmataceae bacterium]